MVNEIRILTQGFGVLKFDQIHYESVSKITQFKTKSGLFFPNLSFNNLKKIVIITQLNKKKLYTT